MFSNSIEGICNILLHIGYLKHTKHMWHELFDLCSQEPCNKAMASLKHHMEQYYNGCHRV